MAEKAKRSNKNLIIGICCAIVAIIAVVVAVVLATSANRLNDAYFQSDDTKYVLTLESSDYSTGDDENAAYTPIKTHLVYTYEGDNITGMKTYGEYADGAAAQAAFDAMKETDEGSVENAVVDGKYIIITNDESAYEGMTAADVKAQIEFMENLKNMNLDSGDESTEATEEQ